MPSRSLGTNLSEIWIKHTNFHTNDIWKCHPPKVRHFIQFSPCSSTAVSMFWPWLDDENKFVANDAIVVMVTRGATRVSIMTTLGFQWTITVTSYWVRYRLKSPASRLFNQPFIQTQIKENIKAPRHWPLFRESVNSPHKWPVTRRMFPFDDVIMDGHQM